MPDSRPSRRGRHGVAGASIRLEKAPALFWARWCESIFDAGPQNAIGAAGGDALTIEEEENANATHQLGKENIAPRHLLGELERLSGLGNS
jgi:hypothetical protein